jgi:hypothetical protein
MRDVVLFRVMGGGDATAPAWPFAVTGSDLSSTFDIRNLSSR